MGCSAVLRSTPQPEPRPARRPLSAIFSRGGGRRFRRSTLAMSTQRAAPVLALNPHGEERRRRVSNREAPAAPDSRRARLNVSPRPCAIISRGASRPSFRIRFALITKEGAGKAGRRPRPWPACSKKAGGSHHRSGRARPAFPARRLERLIRGLPGAPGLLATMRDGALAHARRGTPASGCQDRTTSPCATNRSSARHKATLRFPAPIASHLPRLVTVATRPSSGSRTGLIYANAGKKKRRKIL
ncbi:hypothetical protein ACVIJ6_003697 [Bradyrhizobium sp. USDA 4369]